MGRDVLALVLVGARDEEAREPVPGELRAEPLDPIRNGRATRDRIAGDFGRRLIASAL